MNKRKKLLVLLKKNSLFFNDTKLSSGRNSDFYIDSKMTATMKGGAPLIADLIKEKIGNISVDTVGGPSLGANPILGALSGRGYFDTFLIRKEPKKHGLCKFIEGRLNKYDKNVIIIDDVATTGKSILRSINTVKEVFLNINIKKISVLVDREE